MHSAAFGARLWRACITGGGAERPQAFARCGCAEVLQREAHRAARRASEEEPLILR
jgi:hypothetical protein